MNEGCTTTAVDTPRADSVKVERFTRANLVFEAEDGLTLKYDGNTDRGSVQVVLDVDGMGFDKVAVEDRHDAESQLVLAIEALTETLEILRRLGG